LGQKFRKTSQYQSLFEICPYDQLVLIPIEAAAGIPNLEQKVVLHLAVAHTVVMITGLGRQMRHGELATIVDTAGAGIHSGTGDEARSAKSILPEVTPAVVAITGIMRLVVRLLGLLELRLLLLLLLMMRLVGRGVRMVVWGRGVMVRR
jgi:hypothetical protein